MAATQPGLYVVATPIGNLDDLSPRAAATLAAASIVAAEDTRTSALLLKRAGSKARLISLTEHNVGRRAPGLLEAAKTGVVALVSDAGTPVVADPGARLVRVAHEGGIPVFAVPGPSALAAAISVSGMAGSDVHFLGFLPRQRGERVRRIESAAGTADVLVIFESPGRLQTTLGELAEMLGDPEVAVCRELTKVHEEVVRGKASALSQRFALARGECTIVVQAPGHQAGDLSEVTAYLEEMHRAGARRSAAAAEAARRFGITRETAYEAWPADNVT
jgi:16S rRNA (cytidine1402-2'-O)-methyltransferase